MKKPAPFERSRSKNVRDDVGTVKVKIMLVVGGATPVRGNIVRSFTVAGKKVSAVAARVERALFGTSR